MVNNHDLHEVYHLVQSNNMRQFRSDMAADIAEDYSFYSNDPLATDMEPLHDGLPSRKD